MLSVKKVSFKYSTEPVLQNISFTLKEGETCSLIGASGCGKSTLLKIIYGVLHTEGKIFWKDKELLGPKFNLVPGEPFFKYLAQDFDLILPLTAAENTGKYLSNFYPVKKKRRITELLEVVEMSDKAHKKASELSGGEQQRVALARALASTPQLLLLDEPFSNIDHFRKNNLRRNIYKYLRENNITCITATHDSTDALSFADKTIALKNGKKLAENSPYDLYKNPPSFYVASLFGDVNRFMVRDFLPDYEGNKSALFYPHEINIVSDHGFKALVLDCYFEGEYYLLKLKYGKESIFVKSKYPKVAGSSIDLTMEEKLIRRRGRL